MRIIDLAKESATIARGAINQAQALGADGKRFLDSLKGRLVLASDIAVMPEADLPQKLTDYTLNSAGRAEALRTILQQIDQQTAA